MVMISFFGDVYLIMNRLLESRFTECNFGEGDAQWTMYSKYIIFFMYT